MLQDDKQEAVSNTVVFTPPPSGTTRALQAQEFTPKAPHDESTISRLGTTWQSKSVETDMASATPPALEDKNSTHTNTNSAIGTTALNKTTSTSLVEEGTKEEGDGIWLQGRGRGRGVWVSALNACVCVHACRQKKCKDHRQPRKRWRFKLHTHMWKHTCTQCIQLSELKYEPSPTPCILFPNPVALAHVLIAITRI